MTDPAAADFAHGGDPKVQLRMQESLLAASTVNAVEWTIASDVPVAGRSGNELLVRNMVEQTEQSVVPEPEVVILLATGLLTFGAVAYFRGLVA